MTDILTDTADMADNLVSDLVWDKVHEVLYRFRVEKTPTCVYTDT